MEFLRIFSFKLSFGRIAPQLLAINNYYRKRELAI